MMRAMTKRTIIVAACVLVAGGALAACGGDDDEDRATKAPVTTAAPSGAQAADVVAVDMKDIKYVPQDATAKVGQTVRWTNSDPVAHTVTATKGSDVDSGTIDANETFETKFDKPGKVEYVCTIHPNQTGTVTVVR